MTAVCFLHPSHSFFFSSTSSSRHQYPAVFIGSQHVCLTYQYTDKPTLIGIMTLDVCMLNMWATKLHEFQKYKYCTSLPVCSHMVRPHQKHHSKVQEAFWAVIQTVLQVVQSSNPFQTLCFTSDAGEAYPEYTSPAWNPYINKDINSLESVQKFALKVALNCHTTSCSTSLICQILVLPQTLEPVSLL